MFWTFVFAQEMYRPSSELAASVLFRVLMVSARSPSRAAMSDET